jgi:hypothetical protein
MKHYLFLAISIILFSSPLLQSEEVIDPGFHTDQLAVNAEDIYAISSFQETDYFTVYTHAGDILWEVPFFAKIISWKARDELLFIFSQARNSQAYFISCLDAKKGYLLWEKGIYAKLPNAQ